MLAWLAWALWARVNYLPYDVKNTDIGTYLFQAQTFAAGKIYRATPEPREFFQQWQAVVREKSYAYYPPVHALLLAIPMACHVDPWVMPWLLSGVSIFLLFMWVRQISNEPVALFASFILAFSPFFAANAPTVLNHSTSLFLTLLALISFTRWKTTRETGAVLFSGLFTGLLFATRPLNAVALAIVWCVYCLLPLNNLKTAKQLRSVAIYSGGFLIIFIPLLVYYRALAGYWTLDLFKDYWPRNKFGFGVGLGRGEPGHFFQTSTEHDWSGWVRNVKYTLLSLSEWWSGNIYVTVILAAFAAALVLKCKKLRSIYIAVILWVVSQIFLYAFYYTQSTPPTGPRYVSEIMPALALLSGLCVSTAWVRLNRYAAIGLSLLFLVSSSWFKWNFYQENERAIAPRRQVEECVLKNAKAPALVFIRSFWLGHPFPIFLNHPDMTDLIVYACDRGVEDSTLVAKYPNRNAYILAVTPGSEARLIRIYDASEQKWITRPEEVEAPFYIGSKFKLPLKLQGEAFQMLFHPRPDQIIFQ